MAPRRKTRSMTNATESPSKTLRKKGVRDETNIEEWVYRFLGNLAAIEKDKEETKQRSMGLKTTDQSHSLKAARLRSPTPYAWSPLRHHPIDSDDFNFDEEGDDALITPTSKARTRVSKTLAVDGSHVVHRDPTLLQKINRYIRAGVAEGKRRAKRYVRKALSFAIETGYLVPADRDGKLLRVSPALVAAGKPLVDVRGGRRPQRKRSGRTGGRVIRRKSNRRRTTRARRRRSSDGSKDIPAAAPDVNNSQGNVVTTTNTKRKRSEDPNESIATYREQPDKPSGSRKSSGGRPSSSNHSSPSRGSRQRPIEDLAPLIPRTGSFGADRKPLSARSRPSSFARRSRDDLLA